MTFASVRAAAEHVARQGRLTPHQLAALGRLDELLTDAQRKEFTDLWRAEGSPAAPAPSTPPAAGIALIREFEGVHLQAYRCPAGVPTIGWGSTRYADGRAVAMGDQITRAEADALLTHEVLRIAERLARTVPGWVTMNDNQRGALVSFAYNLGSGFYGAQGFSTITHALAQRRWEDVPAAMLLYRNPGSSFEAGLRRRREAEGRLWMASIGLPPLQQQAARVTPASPFSARLTPNIRVGEFALDQEARRFHHQHQVDTATELAKFLERVRQQFGGRPVVITSGYRPPAINRSVGGASGSEHLYDAPGVGAVDFQIQGADIRNVQAWCDREWPYSLGLGAPKGFVHLGIRAGRPRLRWPY
jgi:GH24 family phage-related lysozyme (muramidase)